MDKQTSILPKSRLGRFASLVLLSGALGLMAASGVVSSTRNPLQIAILHWYGANQTASFGVGNGPEGVAFDGASLWVSNRSDGSVTKLRASDGACAGTCTFAVGSLPIGVAFDGANIWVANFGSSNVTKLKASNGSTLGTFAVGSAPNGVAFDGANIWVANFDSHSVSKL